MTYQYDRNSLLFLSVGVPVGEKRVVCEKIRHFCFLQVLAKILLDLCSAKLGDKRVLYHQKLTWPLEDKFLGNGTLLAMVTNR